MTEEERQAEIALLVEEQQKDDTLVVQPQLFGTRWVTSLDSASQGHDDSKWDWLVGVEHEHNIPSAPGVIRTRQDFQPLGRHGSPRGGVLVQIPHGTPNGYGNYRCRCSRCRAAATSVTAPRVAAYRKRKQDERPDSICPECGEAFRPVPSTKTYCSKRCAERVSSRRRRQRDPEYCKRDNALRRLRRRTTKVAA